MCPTKPQSPPSEPHTHGLGPAVRYMSGFRIDVADLLAHPGTRRALTLEAALDDLVGTSARVEAPVSIDLMLERINEGIVARGTVTAVWKAECSVCLGDVERSLAVQVDELFEDHPVDGETYPIEGHEIDLEQLARDAVLLDLPLAPRCEPDCAPESAGASDLEPPTDPRWAVLSELEL
jgi:uncharacterized protein